MSILKAEVPGKLLLFGEHVVLSGAPGIATTLPITLQAQLDSGYKGFTIIGNSEHTDTVANIADVVWHCLDTVKPEGKLSITSTIPIGQGFGSSAALCTALALLAVRSVSSASSPPVSDASTIVAEQLTPEERLIVWRLAHEGEKLLHGTPSGIDTGAVLHRGLNAFSGFDTFPPNIHPCRPLGAWLVWGYIPRTQSARACIEQVTRARTTQAYRDLKNIAEQSYSIMTAQKRKSDDASNIGKLADAALDCFESLRISSPVIKPLTELAKKQGALGGKLCGAGAGGAFWFIFNTKEQAQKSQQEFLTAGFCNFAEIAEL